MMNNLMKNMNQMGMNNIPMNQMGMNPMMMNNIPINQMGMNPMMLNNQQNFMNGMNMDETSQNINNIIQQYENKIKELEEKIKQKDFEIFVLKQKLNNNISNPNFINMNPMMMDINKNQMNMEMDIIQQPMAENDKISITIKSENDKFVVKCFETDKVSILREKYNINEGHFSYNYKPIDIRLTFKEIGIYNGSTIQVKNRIYTINFIYNGKVIKISLAEDCPLRMAIIYFFIKLKRESLILEILDDKLEIIFLYNSAKLIIDNTHIKDIFFSYCTNPTVNVFDSKNVIG